MKLDDVIEHALDGNAILFAGSGFSRSAKNIDGKELKTGRQLAIHLSQLCKLSSTEALDDIAEFYLSKNTSKDLIDLLRKEFQVKEIAPEHHVFGRIPWKRIYTTNYDNVIERAYSENHRKIVPITLDAPIQRIREESNISVHLNGYIDYLSEEALFSSFKLTDRSYSSDSFVDSHWSGQFRHDLANSRSVLFVGYSAYDLDIKRILLESDDWHQKTFFVVGRNPSELLKNKLGKFGNIVDEDTKTLAEYFERKAKIYIPRKQSTFFGKYVSHMEASKDILKPRDRDIIELLLWGRIQRNFVWGSVTETHKELYVHKREAVNQCIQLIERGTRNLIISSDLGNGKTVFLECLGAAAVNYGYSVYYLGTTGPGSVAEVEALCQIQDQKMLLLIDSYSSKFDELEVISRMRPEQMRIVFSARTLKHDVLYDRLNTLFRVESMVEISLDQLSNEDLSWFCRMFDLHGLWGDKAAWSYSKKLTFFQRNCSGRVSGLLLAVLESPAIKNRIQHLVESIFSQNQFYAETAVCLLAFSVIDIGTNIDLVANLVSSEILNQAKFRKNEAIGELLDFGQGQVAAKSSVVARHILKETIDPHISVNALITMAKNCDKLRAHSIYHTLMRELMRFSNVQNMLPSTHKMNAILFYYEELKNLRSCQKNPNFWLQYAIAVLALKDFPSARIKLETAYAHARQRNNYNTYMIDNTAARLELEEIIDNPGKDRPLILKAFRKAKNIISAQVSRSNSKYYPFRVASYYEPFLESNRSTLNDMELQEIARASNLVLQRILKLPKNQAAHRYVTDCQKAMKRVLEEIPLEDA